MRYKDTLTASHVILLQTVGLEPLQHNHAAAEERNLNFKLGWGHLSEFNVLSFYCVKRSNTLINPKHRTQQLPFKADTSK